MNYRAEIDGLRGIAVSMVIFSHLGLPWMTGGYIGVDVFFVISGYLLAKISLDKLQSGTFSVGHFIERRVRRIVPALVVASLLFTIPSYFIFLDEDLRKTSLTLQGVSYLLANYSIHSNSLDYFSGLREGSPLIHHWSLSIEEHYYIILSAAFFLCAASYKKSQIAIVSGITVALLALGWWGLKESATGILGNYIGLVFMKRLELIGTPISLTIVSITLASVFVFFRYASHPRTRVLILITALSICSLGLAIKAYSFNANNVYFLTPFRLWELGIGSMLAFMPEPKEAFPRLWREFGQALGLLGILIVGVMIDEKTPYPIVVGMLLPCLGTALFIWSSSGPWGRPKYILSQEPFKFTGKISYSLYLVHWPVIAFMTYANTRGPNAIEMFGIILLMTILAWAMWKFIESPFRRPTFMSRRLILAVSAASLFIVFETGKYLEKNHPNKGRLPDQVERVLRESILRKIVCDRTGPDSCSRGEGKIDVMLWGDSHARALYPALQQIADQGEARVRMGPPCTPIFNADYKNCLKKNNKIWNEIQRGITHIVLSSRWSMYAVGFPDFKIEHTGTRWFGYLGAYPKTQQEMSQIWVRAFGDTIKSLASLGIKVILIKPVPQHAFFPRKLVAMDFLGVSWSSLPITDRKVHDEYQALATDTIDKVASMYPNVVTIDPADFLCDKTSCKYRTSQDILYFDDDHLSASGAKLLLPAIRKALDLPP